ncbi:MAG: YjbQ family protein [Candidatus Brockarchaeota archaeon]|nr:YjbQ family protein [Candidatus Brockarchaeota archaeon]MBO3810097.1 YjbQ family protein [Candidatus Brockarchaeota archaeon]MBO3833036.1 YjbQ family protein [Candidatus Brockarchaeota archaeon]MBO3842463.1 YjbQ family protein [Candidatus Brockarchaeota archaeon]
MSYEIIEVSTKTRQQLIEVTSAIRERVRRSGVNKGVCLIHVPHTTAGITLNENADPSVARDILNTLNRLIPVEGDYTHLEGNAHAHVKASIVGHNAILFIEDGELILGTWQGVFLCEFDGPRRRRILLKIIGE